MNLSARPTLARDLVISANYGQFYIFSPTILAKDTQCEGFLIALDDAYDSGRFAGTGKGIIDVLTATQWNWDIPMRLEIWAHVPEDDTEAWDHEVDIDLDVPDGRLIFEASGGGPLIETGIP